MYVIVDDDDDACEPDPVAFRPKTSKSNRFARRQSVSAERYDPEADEDEETPVVHPKTDHQRERLTEAVAGILIFRSLEPEQMQEVIDAMFEHAVKAGDDVIRQGDDGDNFYVIERGLYDVFVRNESDGAQKRVHQFDGKGSFGELALLYNMPRSASVRAVTDGTLWAMDRKSFRCIVLKSACRKRRMYEKLLESVPMLKSLDTYERMSLADALTSRTFTDGQCIIREGDEADGMYFLERGKVRVTITKDGHETEVRECLGEGSYFGEMALVNNQPRSASVYADGPVKVAFLERSSFERLLGPCLDIMKRNIKSYTTSS
jgi:cAMP-dependent protein kinase regulator